MSNIDEIIHNFSEGNKKYNKFLEKYNQAIYEIEKNRKNMFKLKQMINSASIKLAKEEWNDNEFDDEEFNEEFDEEYENLTRKSFELFEKVDFFMLIMIYYNNYSYDFCFDQVPLTHFKYIKYVCNKIYDTFTEEFKVYNEYKIEIEKITNDFPDIIDNRTGMIKEQNFLPYPIKAHNLFGKEWQNLNKNNDIKGPEAMRAISSAWKELKIAGQKKYAEQANKEYIAKMEEFLKNNVDIYERFYK